MLYKCNYPGCKEIVQNNTRCEQHAINTTPIKMSGTQSTTVNQAFYNSKAWRALRHYYITKNPLCEHCLKEGVIVPAHVVDHIIEINDDDSKKLDVNNLQSLCGSHHGKKTYQRALKRKRGY
ncbi:HNH endonuclease signature motif containing protein [Aeromonas veronii]